MFGLQPGWRHVDHQSTESLSYAGAWLKTIAPQPTEDCPDAEPIGEAWFARFGLTGFDTVQANMRNSGCCVGQVIHAFQHSAKLHAIPNQSVVTHVKSCSRQYFVEQKGQVASFTVVPGKSSNQLDCQINRYLAAPQQRVDQLVQELRLQHERMLTHPAVHIEVRQILYETTKSITALVHRLTLNEAHGFRGQGDHRVVKVRIVYVVKFGRFTKSSKQLANCRAMISVRVPHCEDV